MSRLRRLALSDRFFFLTVKLLPRRRRLEARDFAVLARCLNAVRSRQRFLLTAWVFLPDPWHAILFPPHPLTVSERGSVEFGPLELRSPSFEHKPRTRRGESALPCWQWSADGYQPYPGHQSTFPIPADAKVIRGGSFESDKDPGTTTARNLDHASTRSPTIGFRCAK